MKVLSLLKKCPTLLTGSDHRSLLSKLPSYGFHLSLRSFIFNFFSGRSISVIIDGHCSAPNPINNGVPHGSIMHSLSNHDLSKPTVLYIPIPMTVIHYFTTFTRRPSQKELHNSRLGGTRRLTSDRAIISEWNGTSSYDTSFWSLRNLHSPSYVYA